MEITSGYVIKKSGKPFPSKFYVETVVGIEPNLQHPAQGLAAVLSGGGICNLSQLKRYEPPHISRVRDRIYCDDFVKFLQNAIMRLKHVTLEENNGEKYRCIWLDRQGSIWVDSVDKLYSIIVGVYQNFPDAECYVKYNRFVDPVFNVKWNLESNDDAFMDAEYFNRNFKVKEDYIGWEAGLAYGV
jgi:hypothetical protein